MINPHHLMRKNLWIDVERGEWGSHDDESTSRGFSIVSRWFVLGLRMQKGLSGSIFQVLYTPNRSGV